MREQLQDIATAVQWRLEAQRTGRSYAEVARRRALIYRVEQLFLVHRATHQWLLHVAEDPKIADDPATLALLSEVQLFARDHLFAGSEGRIEEFSVGENDVWIAAGEHAYLAAVIRGNPPDKMRAALQHAIERIQERHGAALAAFNGDSSAFQDAGSELTACLTSEYKRMPQFPDLPRVPRLRRLPQLPRLAQFSRVPRLPQLPAFRIRWAVAVAAVLLLGGILFSLRSEKRWRQFVTTLKAEPGVLVAAAERNWFAPSRVAGLRDARSRDPAAIAREAKLNPDRIRFEWKDYVAGDVVAVAPSALQSGTPIRGALGAMTQRAEIAAPSPGHALERFKAEFPLPPGVAAVVANETLVLAGNAPYEWVDAVRAGATKIQGIRAINGDDLVVEFDPELVLRRFRDAFGIPETVKAAVRGGRLTLTGEAPHEWLHRVRRGAMHVPGIHVLDDRKVEDIDQRAFTESKAAVEEASVLFGLSRDSVRPDATPVLERVAEQARRCFGAAANLGVNVRLEIRGYGDAITAEAENRELSRRRADAVRGVLAASGVDREKVDSLGLGTPPPPEPGEKRGAGKFDRRVFFRAVIQP